MNPDGQLRPAALRISEAQTCCPERTLQAKNPGRSTARRHLSLAPLRPPGMGQLLRQAVHQEDRINYNALVHLRLEQSVKALEAFHQTGRTLI